MKHLNFFLVVLLASSLFTNISALAATPSRHATPPTHHHKTASPPKPHRMPPSHGHYSGPPPNPHHAPPSHGRYSGPPPRPHHGPPPHGHHANWRKGRVLPREIIFHDVSYQYFRLPAPPPRHRYVRVGDDILQIIVGTGLIVDVWYNLAR